MRKIDGGRQRCVGCGHPRKEHNDREGCSVPKCACSEYMQPADPELSGRKGAKRSS